jgi:signal transduction histidine kinase
MAVHFSKDNPEGVETVIILFDQTARYQKDDHGASFVSMAVHELRTPLTVMRGYIELFEDEIAPKLDAEQTEFMRNLSAQAQQLGAFISNVQNFARIEENELSLSLKEEAWKPIVEGAVRDMNLRANVRKKTLLCQIQPNLPPVAVDRSTIYEVLVNLIENAVKYTHNDAPVIIRTYKKDENWVETVVEDKGIGIPDSVMAHIFDKFYRSHRSSKTVGGTGLGLYLSKTIVSAHGGEIWVKSREGEGSTFGFSVPTFSSVASQLTSADNKTIVRGAHGWIKNHSLYRG